MCPSHFCRVRVGSESSQIFSSRVRVRFMTWSSRVRVEPQKLSSRFESFVCKLDSMSSHMNFHIFLSHFYAMNGAQHGIKWCPISKKMVPNMLLNHDRAQSCFNKFDCRLFISKFSQYAFYLSFSLSLISKSLAQPCCKCCNHSVRDCVECVIRLKRDVHEEQRPHIGVANYVSQTRRRMSTTWDLNCCLLPQCEALHTCCLCFPITTNWCFDQDVKVVTGATFTNRKCDRCCSLQTGGYVVVTSQLMLRWKCDSPQMGCAQWATHKYMWREEAIIEWSHQVISIIACCHSVTLCALAVRAVWSQHKKYTSDLDWLFSFELYRNFRFSFGTTGYCSTAG